MPDKWGLPTKKELTFYQTKAGDRTITPAQKRKIKEEQKFRCAKCGKKFHSRLLEIHHKKEVHKHKNSLGVDIPVMTFGYKHKPKYDRRENLEAVCVYCHDKTKKTKKPRKKQNSIGNININDLI